MAVELLAAFLRGERDREQEELRREIEADEHDEDKADGARW